jgi:plastocyanin
MSLSKWFLGSLGSLVLLSCGGGGGSSSPTEPQPQPQPQVVTIEVRDNTYSPKSVTIRPGDTVRWVLRGSDLTHTVTALDGAFSGTFPQAGMVFERRFDNADRTFDYRCQAHADCCQMQGSVRVGTSAPPPRPGYE